MKLMGNRKVEKNKIVLHEYYDRNHRKLAFQACSGPRRRCRLHSEVVQPIDSGRVQERDHIVEANPERSIFNKLELPKDPLIRFDLPQADTTIARYLRFGSL